MKGYVFGIFIVLAIAFGSILAVMSLKSAQAQSSIPGADNCEVFAQRRSCTLYKCKDGEVWVYWSVCDGYSSSSVTAY